MKKSHYAVFEILINGKRSFEFIHAQLKERLPFMGTGVNPVNVMMLLSKLCYLGYIRMFTNGKYDTFQLTQKGRDQLSKRKKES